MPAGPSSTAVSPALFLLRTPRRTLLLRDHAFGPPSWLRSKAWWGTEPFNGSSPARPLRPLPRLRRVRPPGRRILLEFSETTTRKAVACSAG